MIFFYFSLFLFNIFFTLYFHKISKYLNLFDKPDTLRKFHKKKIANIGGFFFIFNFIFLTIYILLKHFDLKNITLFFTNYEIFYFFIFSFIFFLVGFIDDKYGLNANAKLIIFCTIIYIFLSLDNTNLITKLKFSFLSNEVYIGNLSFFFTLFSFLLFINAFNMFDGINLQASLYTFFLFLIFLVNSFAIEIVIILGISLIFFIYLNYNNKCFLGDNGSLLIAFILSYLFIKSYNTTNIFYADQIFLLMMIPGVDLLRLFILRILNKRHPFQADRSHIHHYLLNKFSLKGTLIIIFSIIIIPNTISLIFGGTLYLILLSGVLYFICIFLAKK